MSTHRCVKEPLNLEPESEVEIATAAWPLFAYLCLSAKIPKEYGLLEPPADANRYIFHKNAISHHLEPYTR